LTLLSQAGYFSSPVPSVQTLPAFARATDANYSLEYRVRSYLSENCVQCHQPGGAGAPTWDARPWLTLDQTLLINGALDNDGGDPLNKLIVPGDTNHSVLLRRIEANGFSRMPPLATHQLDPGAISLVTQWITTELTNRQTFADWQLAHFGSTNDPNAAATADPDHDGANNFLEYLTQTDPQDPGSAWRLGVAVTNGLVEISYVQVPNLGVVIELSSNLVSWAPWDVAGNQPLFPASGGAVSLSGPRSAAAGGQYFRARLIVP